VCYSAQVWQNYRKYVRAYGADIAFEDFVRLYFDRQANARIRIAKAMDAAFSDPQNEAERRIKTLIDEFDRQRATKLEQELFKQRKRLADAERALQVKTTKAAAENKRIASEKVEWCLGKLAEIRRAELVDEDSRIFPGWYAPVVIVEDGKRVVKPMRYQCRPAGKPEFYDTKYPGTYNARRDNLEGFWKGQFGHTHGITIARRFYENVDRNGKNAILEFTPAGLDDMIVACLYSHWTGTDGEDLWSFAAITDEPPAEVAAAGHDRCIIPIKPENIDGWLNPDPSNLAAQYAILDDRERPYYEHRLAA